VKKANGKNLNNEHYHQWRIQKFGIGGGRVGGGDCVPSPKNFIPKIMHFGGEFSLVLRCIRSIGVPAPPLLESALCIQ